MVDWGDNTTAITGLSDLAYPPDLMGRWGEDVSGGSGGGSTNTSNSEEDGWRFKCHRYALNTNTMSQILISTLIQKQIRL